MVIVSASGIICSPVYHLVAHQLPCQRQYHYHLPAAARYIIPASQLIGRPYHESLSCDSLASLSSGPCVIYMWCHKVNEGNYNDELGTSSHFGHLLGKKSAVYKSVSQSKALFLNPNPEPKSWSSLRYFLFRAKTCTEGRKWAGTSLSVLASCFSLLWFLLLTFFIG